MTRRYPAMEFAQLAERSSKLHKAGANERSDFLLSQPLLAAAENASKRHPKVPKYIAIRNWLLDRIVSGEIQRGEQLPSEHAIMELFEVSRVTVRQALDELKAMKLVEARRGKGYFASRLHAVQNLERLQSFGEVMAPLKLETRSDVIELLIVAADAEVAEYLRINRDDAAVRLARTRIAGGSVVSLDISYYPEHIGKKLMHLDLSHEDVFHLMERQLSIELGYADVILTAVPVAKRHAEYLQVKEGEEVMQLRRIVYDDSGVPVAYERLYSRLDTLEFRARIPRW